MLLYFFDENDKKRYLAYKANTRSELAGKLERNTLEIKGVQGVFNVNDVQAEISTDNRNFALILGACIGLLGGPIGVFIGGMFGMVIGSLKYEEERKEVQRFNESVNSLTLSSN